MCGIDLDEPIVKSDEDVLRATYKWRPTLENPPAPLLSISAIPCPQSVSIAVTIYNPRAYTLQNIQGKVTIVSEVAGEHRFLYPLKDGAVIKDDYVTKLEYPEALFTIPSILPYHKVTLSFVIGFDSQTTYIGTVAITNPSDAVTEELFAGTTLLIA